MRPLAAAVLLALAACRPALDGLGAADAHRARNASQLFTALTHRFHGVHRSPRYAATRARIAKGWLSPAAVFRDTSVWLTRSDSLATFTALGRQLPFGYALQERQPVPPLVSLADARHTLALRPTADKDWEWDARVDFAIGTVRANDMARLFTDLLAAGEGKSDHDLKAQVARELPASVLAAGRLWDMDSLRALPLADGSSSMLLATSLHPERIAVTLPAFSTFMRRYLLSASWRLVLREKSGATWFFIDSKNGLMQMRWRVYQGALLPFEGAARPMPDDLELDIETKAKVGMFTVGLSQLVADFTIVHSATERGWDLHFARPPKWQLPLGVARLMNASLKRPFEGEGSTFRIVFRDNEGGPTTISRTTRGFVRESAIVRWMGALSGTVAGDFSGASELEEARFMAELFAALNKDGAASYARTP